MAALDIAQFVFRTVGLPTINLVSRYVIRGIHTIFVLSLNRLVTGKATPRTESSKRPTRSSGWDTKGKSRVTDDDFGDTESEQEADGYSIELDPAARKFLRDAALAIVMTYIVGASLYNWTEERAHAESVFEESDRAYQNCVKLSLPCANEREARVVADINRGYVKLTWYVILDILKPIYWMSASAWHMRPDLYLVETMTFIIISCVLLSVVCVAIFVMVTVYQNFWPEQATRAISRVLASLYARFWEFATRWLLKAPSAAATAPRARARTTPNGGGEHEQDAKTD